MLNTLRRAYASVIRIASVTNSFGTLIIFALVAIMNADVIARGLFHSPIRGVVEIVIFSLVLIVFLQLPDVVQNNRLTRSDGFLQMLDNRSPAAGSVLRRLIDGAACIFMLFAAWTSWPEFAHSLSTCEFSNVTAFANKADGSILSGLSVALGRCEYFGTPGVFTAPWWPVKLAVAMSLSLCAAIFAFKALFGTQPMPNDSAAEPSS